MAFAGNPSGSRANMTASFRARAARVLTGAAFACGLLLAATPAAAQFGGTCTRDSLQAAVNAYVAAQTAGDPGKLMLGNWVNYTENMDASASLFSGIISKPLKIDFHRALLDSQSCQAFVEVIVTDPAHPYVLGVAFTSRASMNPIDILVTDKEDWLFNAANTLKYSKAEQWDAIPEGERDSRETIVAAADAYLNLFDDKNVQVPWGTPCARLEGGLYSGRGAPGVATPEDTCNVGVPSGVKLINRRYIVDEALGAVAVLLNFGEKERPDAHIFRVEKGKIRYVHTITVCDEPNCGFPLPEALKTAGD